MKVLIGPTATPPARKGSYACDAHDSLTVTFLLRVAVGVVVATLLLGAAGVVASEHVQHEHPEEAAGDGDLASVERWLSGQLGERHVDCADGLAVGDFDPCEDLDEEYESLLERYVTVERERDGDTSTSERLNETRQQQREYAALREEFDRTYEEYREARQAGDEASARERARELQRLAARLEELGADLDVHFRELDGAVEGNLTAASDSIGESTEEVRTVTLRVERETFEETRVTALADGRAAFDDPAPVTGFVTTENDTRVSGGRVVVDDGGQTFATAVDGNGTYRVPYRPAVVPQGRTELTVQYVPDDALPYLGSNTTVTTTVEGTPSEVAIESANDTVALGEPLRVRGAVRAGDAGPAGVPVAVAADGVVLAANRTDENGTFDLRTRFPADVRAGDVTFTVAASAEGLAVEPSRTAVDLTVEETPTSLGVTATRREGAVFVSGRLEAGNGAPVGERPVTVAVGETETAVTTADDGTYQFEYDGDDADDVDAVAAAYDEEGSNLAASSARTNLGSEGSLSSLATGGEDLFRSIWASFRSSLLPLEGEGLGGDGDGLLDTLLAFARAYPLLSGAVLLGVLLNAVAWGYLARTRWKGSGPAATRGSETSEERDAAAEDAPARPVPDLLLDSARRRVDSDPNAAVRTGYAAVRTGLDGQRGSQTHWEFYRTVGSDLDEDRQPSLRSITETFEQAAFAAKGVDAATARAALEDAERCLAETG